MTEDINGVEIFAEGTWNKDPYSSDDLDAMVANFQASKDKVKPFIKLGHGDNQVLLERDGLPAAGWITNLYRQGHKLLVDIKGMPKVIADLVRSGGYRRVSSEILINPTIEGKSYSKVLKAVAFLGGEMPAVTNLKDIMALGYSIAQDKNLTECRVYTLDLGKEADMAEVELLKEKVAKIEADLSETTKKLSDAEGKVKEVTAALEKSEGEAKVLREENVKFKAEAEKAYAAKRKTEIEATVDNLIRDKKIAPAQKDLATALLETAPGEVKFSANGKDLKTGSDLVLAFINAGSDGLKTEEDTDAGEKQTDMTEQAKKYAEQHKVSFKEALLKLDAEQKAKASAQ